ncbi:restriction endonuclease subunit S [Helicobacter japonicus]|uniref:restriction endonuclease subunit S n=1 Tax=Helicobacter japonicus TaxID=425400 RepID=UPI0023EFEDDA|nr:restriction endonuclease subunit S [Helicobacter japonicus]
MRFKDSGIEWLGEIPEHWEVRKLKYLAQFYTGNSIKDSEKSQYEVWEENSIPYIATKDIEIDSCVVDYENGMYIKKNNLNFLKAPKSSVLLCVEGGSAGKKLAFLNQEVCFVNKLCCINADKISINKKMLFYILQSNFFGNLFFSSIKGLIGGITSKELAEFKIPLPPLEEQKAIAEFLDKKCNKISQFIESKQKLITLLQEKKQALINECVTKGLNCYTKHNVESRPLRGAQKEKDSRQYKNSGVEYLGTIPKHWEVRRLASFGKFSKGGNIGRNDLLDEGISTLIYGDIYTKYEIKTHTLHSKVSQETAKNATPIYKGDILFSGSGETKEDIGKNIVYLGDEKAFAGGDVIIFRQNQNDALFLSYALNTQGVRFCKLIESKGEIIVHIYASNLRDIKIPLPPLQEQKAIASYLDTQITKIDLAIEKTKQQITYIKEYKTSLINQVICGRIQQKD